MKTLDAALEEDPCPPYPCPITCSSRPSLPDCALLLHLLTDEPRIPLECTAYSPAYLSEPILPIISSSAICQALICFDCHLAVHLEAVRCSPYHHIWGRSSRSPAPYLCPRLHVLDQTFLLTLTQLASGRR